MYKKAVYLKNKFNKLTDYIIDFQVLYFRADILII